MKRIFFLPVLFASFFAVAQTSDTTELLPVEIKTLRASASAPFAKTNLNKGAIQKQNLGQDLPFILNQTPSVIVNSDAGNGIGYTGIRIRGTDATRINVTLNGVPFNDPESNGTYFVDLPDIISSTSSIQVQRGVGTSTNGAGAFGGSIHLGTNEINQQPYFESNNSYGSFYSTKNNIRLGTGLLNNHFTVDARLSRISSNGYIERAKTNLQSYYFSAAYVNDNTTLRFTNFSGKEKTYQAWNGVAEADLKLNRRINYAGTDKPGEPYNNETDNYQQDHYQLLLAHQLTSAWDFSTTLFYIKGKGYYEQYKAGEAYADYNLPNRIFGTDTVTTSDIVRQLWLDNDYYGAVFSSQYTTHKSIFSVGGMVSNYLGHHYGDLIWAQSGLPTPTVRWYQLDAIKNDGNVYGKWQYTLTNKLSAYADVQLRGVNYTINGFKNNPTLKINQRYNFLNPKVGLTYTTNHWTVFSSYAMANKEPNRDDFEAAANELPKPEKLNDWEAGIFYNSLSTKLGATFYYMLYKDQLVLTGKINDVGAYARTNIDNSYRLGVELEGATIITKWLRASANVTLSRNKVKNFIAYIDDYDNGAQKTEFSPNADLSFSPAVTGAATVTLTPTKNLSLDLLSKYVGKQYLDNTSNESRKLNGFYTQDVRVAYSFSKARLKNTMIVFQVNNVFNKMYEPNGYTFSYYYNNKLNTENYYFPMAGINWMVGVNVRL